MLTSSGEAINGLYLLDAEVYKSPPIGIKSITPFKEAIKQLDEYFAGKRKRFELPLATIGSEFQKRVWNELNNITYGKTQNYGNIAKALGDAAASRAVGMA